MLDDLRKDALSRDYDEFESTEDEVVVTETRGGDDERFLGMTAVERMFLSIFLFMNVLVLGLALLIATNRIVL